MKHNETTDEIQKKLKYIKDTLKTNRAKALGVAVLLTVNTSLTGCQLHGINDSYLMGGTNNQALSPNPTPTPSSPPGSGGAGGYHGGGHYGGNYFYSRGSSYKSGSWGKYGGAESGIGSSSYGKGGTVGIGG